MKLDLHRVIELFQKSFSASLSDKEKEDLDDVLQNDWWIQVINATPMFSFNF